MCSDGTTLRRASRGPGLTFEHTLFVSVALVAPQGALGDEGAHWGCGSMTRFHWLGLTVNEGEEAPRDTLPRFASRYGRRHTVCVVVTELRLNALGVQVANVIPAALTKEGVEGVIRHWLPVPVLGRMQVQF
ncbi:hypothetical protein H257_10858 [Aphanomyces astaci]|uniref:Uncharacterized protein n=1 Tax=Aphanomyces astaci TaxID=112090 RepID=W4G4Y8_APHAT|nr:hypothetical protein H257_10858 [Aphanomyces astaci]ETV74787.1 hypothetical protein H257_10858 [Aphanomyces astaci]|eukprot:XP_009835874.1 hypothetical protein H257_10858 [Aphanomyces astaci]